MVFRLSKGATAKILREKYDFEEWRVVRVFEIVSEFGRDAEPVMDGFIHVVWDGVSENWPYTERYKVYEHTGGTKENFRFRRAGKVAPPAGVDYTSGNDVPLKPKIRRRGITMPPRGRRAAAAPAPEPEEVEEEAVETNPYDKYLTKPLTPTMEDYAAWFEQEVAAFEDLEPERILALGSTLYPKFQKSDLNQERRAKRQASRAAAEPEEEEEEAPAKPARRGAKPAVRGAANGKAAAKPAAKAPARGRRAAAVEAAY